MSPRIRAALLAVAALAAVAAVASELGLFLSHRLGGLDRPLVETPALVERGREVFERRCLGCHDVIPIRPRVLGWDVRHAYETLGRLQDLQRGMPRFPGDDEERRALAAWLAAEGRGAR